ncbi:MAG: 4Fe-4S dicluster domain-containing protein [Deltaproteobacteria bacterium]|nr:4Fe-4S dicluster domain-containing protein [Deltaproteobacteria bacterium]
MGHLRQLKHEYRALARRLERSPLPLPEPDELRAWQGWREILEILFTPEQADLCSRLPLRSTTLAELEARLGIAREPLRARLDAMCDKGIVMDLVSPKTGEVKYLLAPPLGGFLEFSMMRAKDTIPKKRMAEALEAYLHGAEGFARAVLAGDTRFGRTLAHETALGDELPLVLDWERASAVVESARAIAVSLCFCRHSAEHLGRRCDAPMDNCLSLGAGAEFVIRRGFGRRVERAEALDILVRARESGLVQLADNVRERPAFLCNCCGCCCEQLRAINRFDLPAVSPSGFVPARDEKACKGCSRCARACPIAAITLVPRRVGAQRRSEIAPRLDLDRCIGCGLCVHACRRRALRLVRRERQPLVPQNGLERVVRMALARGRLAELVFDQSDGRGARFLEAVLGALGRLGSTQRALANEQLRSRFVRWTMDRMRPPAA